MNDFDEFWSLYPRRISKRTAQKACGVEGCGKEVKATGLCSSHYNKKARYGDVHGGQDVSNRGRSIMWLQDALSASDDECKIWPIAPTHDGYAVFSLNGKRLKAHQFCCEYANGPRPIGLEASHECGVSLCCNPRHLSWKTHAENIADKHRHGTALLGERHHHARLTEAQVLEIRSQRGKISRKSLAGMYGVARATIDNVIDRTTWTHI